MKPFKDVTKLGNEKAVRKGRNVPDGDVNLAYFKAQEVSPKSNVLIVDTSRAIEENISTLNSGCQLYYANEYGVLTDMNGNIAFSDSEPVISDEFSIEEDFSIVEGSEYTTDSILPYVHTSRFFHVDLAGLSIAGMQTPYQNDKVKVVDGKGREYPNQKIKIVPAAIENYSQESTVWGYRVLAYVDTATREDLYLRYHKTELDPDGLLVNRETDYKEILNPRPFFVKVPEESEVIDPVNSEKKIYSSSPLSVRDREIGLVDNASGGHKIFVPKKAITDPRIYQLFRWRVKTSFVQDIVVDDSPDVGTIKCGVLATSKAIEEGAFVPGSYALANLQNSRYNASQAKFENPKGEGEQTQSSYWLVNIDSDDLSEYDFLIWTPTDPFVDVSKYTPKLNTFVRVHGGTLFFDTESRVDAYDYFGGELSQPVKFWNGLNRPAQRGVTTGSVSADEADVQFGTDHLLLKGNAKFGGWDISPSSVEYLTAFQFNASNYAQFFVTDPDGYTPVVTSEGKSLVVMSPEADDRGAIILSTIGVIHTCSNQYNYTNNEALTTTVAPFSTPTYELNVNGPGVEGAMKILYNAALISLRNKTLINAGESSFSTTWTHETQWESSWVINAFDDVLSETEKQDNSFYVDAQNPLDGDFTPVWKRKLANRTIKEIADEEIEGKIEKDPILGSRIKNSNRIYELEVTNPEVQTPLTVLENSPPEAWTLAYSPRFTVPPSLGPHVVQEVVDADGIKGIKPDYSSDILAYTDYPDQPYSGRVRSLHAKSREFAVDKSSTYTATGTATGKFSVTKVRDIEKTVSTATTSSVLKELSWAEAYGFKTLSTAGSPTSPGDLFKIGNFPEGFIRPKGIRTWQDYNYKSSSFGPGNLVWPYMGFQSRVKNGSSGDVVKYIQEMLNRFSNAHYFSNSKLKVDGGYGNKTEAAVENFQSSIGARFVDGVVDAETWWLIAAWINRLEKDGKLGSNYLDLVDNAVAVQPHRLSDGSTAYYAKRSWTSGGPEVVWDLISLTFDKAYKIEKVSLTPYLIGEAKSLLFQSIHVKNGNDLGDYSADTAQIRSMGRRVKTGVKETVSVGPYTGNTIVVGIGQDKPYKKNSTSRFLGVQELTAHVRVNSTDTTFSTVLEKQEYITEASEVFTFQVTGSITLDATSDKAKQLHVVTFPDKYESISNINFDSIVVDNNEVIATITPGGKAEFSTQVVGASLGNEVKNGPTFPGGTFYSMSPEGIVSPRRETGWINKTEGIKLLCEKDGDPYGFPTLPSTIGNEDTQRHNVNLTLTALGLGSEVSIGFYDRNQQEFVTSPSGKAELSYIDYIGRGPHNIYIAVISEYEKTNQRVVPEDADAPRLPYKRAMPVYGVCVSKGVDIALESLPEGLGVRDVWPIPIRAGEFVKTYEVPTKRQVKLSGLLSSYQGEEIECVYAVPEALVDQGSVRYGPRVQDVKDETPSIETDKILKVRQAPIHMASYPTSFATKADPVRPVFSLYKRVNASSSWVEVPFSEIADFNVSTGEIFLKTPLTSLDENLIKIDYASDHPYYNMKKSKDGEKVNLNVFAAEMPDYTGKPIYVYIVPHYFRDSAGKVVVSSIKEKTVGITSNKNVFNPLSPEYDPLAIQLGVVYTSRSSDIEELALFDSRTRGGGAKDDLSSKELARVIEDALSYWDVDYGSGVSYPRQGYVVVRLPETVLNHIDRETVNSIVGANMTAGVGFDIVYT